MALAAATVWEVRSVGSDVAGGGFVAGASGSDFSFQDAKNTVGNNISTTDAVAVGTTTLTSATANFTSSIVGNIIYLAGGTGSLAAVRRQVVTFTNITTIVLDAAVAAGTGITLNIGGALATVATLFANWVGSNKAFVKVGTGYTESPLTISTGIDPTPIAPATMLIGYGTTRGDGQRATIHLNTGAPVNSILLLVNNPGVQLYNLDLDCNGVQGSVGVRIIGAARDLGIFNCRVRGYDGIGVKSECPATIGIFNSEITGGGANATAGITFTGVNAFLPVFGCSIHDNLCTGIADSGNQIYWNQIFNNESLTKPTDGTTKDADGVQFGNIIGGVTVLLHNVIYGNGRYGVAGAGSKWWTTKFWNNIIANNPSGGLNGYTGGAGIPAHVFWDGNAYWNNTGGDRLNCDDITVNPQNGVVPYVNQYDVTLTTDPFVNATDGDFRLNLDTGGGAACRNVGVPRTISVLTPTRTPTMGVFQGAGVAKVTPAAFNPLTTYTGLEFYVDSRLGTFQDTGFTTPATVDGDPVKGWQDQSGKGRHLTQGTATKWFLLKTNVQNTLPACRSDGVDDFMKTTLFNIPQPTTYYFVITPKGITTSKYLFDAMNSGHRQYGKRNSGTGAMGFAAGGSEDSTLTAFLATGTPLILTAAFNANCTYCAANNARPVALPLLGNPGFDSIDAICLGAALGGTTQWGDWDYFAVLMYSDWHGKQKRLRVVNWLNSIWGVF